MLKQKTLRWIVILSILVAVSVPMINLGYVYPSFVDHTVSAVEKDAVRISKLLGRVILAENNWEDWISLGMIPDFIKNDIEKVVDDIELLKLKFFLADGKTIYSTDIDDVGKRNVHDYFHRQVALGKTFVKMVRKEQKSLEGQTYRQDVVEVYVPVMQSGEFLGAFELYIDVTEKFSQLHVLLIKISAIPTTGILLFLCVMILLTKKLKNFIQAQHQAELDLTDALDASWKLTEQLEENHRLLTQKTAETEEVNLKLKQTQSQMLQKEKMATVGQLAAGVAHEINNPMGFITSNLNTLGKYLSKINSYISEHYKELEQLLNPEQLAELMQKRRQAKIDRVLDDIPELLEESLDGATRVKEIVQNLKTFSRIDEAETKEANLNDCLESTLKMVWNEIKYKAKVAKDYGDLPPIKCYPQQLNQVFMNMLVNGAHAIEQEGEIGVRTWADATSIYVVISDNGCGMPPEVQERIFEPFFTTKDVGKGTGLGMSIAYEIVQRHAGEIKIDSREGEGTSFTIRLPFVVEEKKHESAA